MTDNQKQEKLLFQALVLLKRQYCAKIKPHWAEGESEEEVASATNNFLSNTLGEQWDEYKADFYHRIYTERSES